MEAYGLHAKNRYEMFLYVTLFLAAILPAFLVVINIRIYPDSMIYSLMSQELLSGNGMRLPIIKLDAPYEVINGTIAYPEEGPLLTMLFALMGGVTPLNYLPAQIVNVISHACTSFFTFLIMKKIYNNTGIAVLTGVLASFAFPVLLNTHRMVTESLFIGLAVVSLYFLCLSRQSLSYTHLIIAGICVSGTILSRFPGIALIPVVLWLNFLFIRNKNIKTKYLPVVTSIALPIITACVLLLRNYIHSGSIFGWKVNLFERSYLDAFTGTLKTILQGFRFGDRAITLITIVTILLFLYIIINRATRRELSRYFATGLDLVILFILSYTSLIITAMIKSQAVFELRYMSPLAPFLFILFTIIIVSVSETTKIKGFSHASLFVLVLSLGLLTIGNFYKTYSNSSLFFSKQEEQYFLLSSPTFKWLKETYEENIIITSNKPYHLSFFGGYSTIALPHKRFDKSLRIDHIESVLPDRMSKFKSRVLALFIEADAQYEGSYIAGLFNEREDNDKFVLIHKFSDGVVYELKE